MSGGNIKISRMVLYFKLDTENRLWLLFSTSIKIIEKCVEDCGIERLVSEKEDKKKCCNRELSPKMIMVTFDYTEKKSLNNLLKV
jgi:hypothetical protein